MMDHIKAVIFDLDGTLLDSMWIWPTVDEEYARKYHLTIPEGFGDAVEGMSYTETAQYFLKQFPELHQTIEEVQEEWVKMTFHKYTEEVKMKEGALEFLLEQKKRGVKLGIATSNSRTLVEASLKALEIDKFFQAICTSCEVCAGKPAPDVYLKAAENLQTDPSDCLVFEDIPMGILAGKNAGMKVCAVEDAFSASQREKKRELADYYIQNYLDVIQNTYEVLS